ncbi:MAG TPA: histidine kinase [Candidatus Sulfotelmatobacter sp.]|nr:histidine kinase [Candidatus Sulfotelmatobacter sp.]
MLATTSVLTFPYIEARVPHPEFINALLLAYCAHSLALMGVLWFRIEAAFRFAWLVHTSDLLWPVLITLFTHGSSSPFFLYFMFALLGAAFRWGMRDALLTAVITVAAMAAESGLLALPWMFHIFASHFDPDVFIIRSVYIVIFGFLIGYLAESEKRRHAEALSIARVSAEIRVDTGLKGTLQGVLQEILKLFAARQLLLVAGETESVRANIWRAERLDAQPDAVFSWGHLDLAERGNYSFEFPESASAGLWRRGSGKSTMMLNREGNRVRVPKCGLPDPFIALHPFKRMLAVDACLGPDVSARLFLFEPKLGGSPEEQLRFLQQLTTQISPSVYNVYILRRLRSRVAEVERGRVARELHDGVVQSLHAIAFRLYALRTSPLVFSDECQQELIDIQELVQEATADLRTLIHQVKPVDIDPRRLVDFLAGMVERYRYETGIGAKFVCDEENVTLRPQACRDIAGIVQEALANVKKHSGADNVLIRLGGEQGNWVLAIEDDGRGFAFSGRVSQPELEKMRVGPLIIKERVRSLGGEMTIESKPGQGARLLITFPQMSMSSTA